jgi:DNA-binding NtrC family response regulator
LATPLTGNEPNESHRVETESPCLLAIVELGGYPNLIPLYNRLGFDTEVVNSQRKAQSFLKRRIPDVIVAEYNFQSDFRDRTSNLETLMAALQSQPQVKVIVFFQQEYEHKLQDLMARFPIYEAIPFPVEPARLEAALRRALRGMDKPGGGSR